MASIFADINLQFILNLFVEFALFVTPALQLCVDASSGIFPVPDTNLADRVEHGSSK